MALKNSLPERYPKIIAMYAKGQVNALDLLKADYGHFPPNGLDIVHPPTFDVKFKSMFSTWTGLKNFVPSPSMIFWGAVLGGRLGIGYVAVQTLARVMSLGGFVYSDQDPTIYMNDGYRGLTFFQGGRKLLSHMITHEFKHVVQGRDDAESLSSALSDRLKIINKIPKDQQTDALKYVADEAEMQARMHTILVGAYHQFEVMPTTPFELFAVLHSQGLDLPDQVMSMLRETRGGRAALDKFKRDDDLYSRYADGMAVSDLNAVLGKIASKHVINFWEKDMTFIYGDLLELYGDRYGHKRMGHTHNIQLREVFYRSATDIVSLQSGKELPLKIKTPDRKPLTDIERNDLIQSKLAMAMKAIKCMAADDAADLGCMMLRGDMYQEYGKASRITATNSSIGAVAVRQIFARNDLSADHRESLRAAANKGDSGGWRVTSSTHEELSDIDSRSRRTREVRALVAA